MLAKSVANSFVKKLTKKHELKSAYVKPTEPVKSDSKVV